MVLWQDVDARCLLRGAAFQLRDQHDNAVEMAGVAVRLLLLELPGASDRGQLPELEAIGAAPTLGCETDERGRVFWDQICILQGSGMPLALKFALLDAWGHLTSWPGSGWYDLMTCTSALHLSIYIRDRVHSVGAVSSWFCIAQVPFKLATPAGTHGEQFRNVASSDAPIPQRLPSADNAMTCRQGRQHRRQRWVRCAGV